MKFDVSHLLLVLLVMLTVPRGALSNNVDDGITVYLEEGPRAVIAFLPPSMRDLETGAAAEAQASVREAIETTKLCLGEVDISYRVVFADRIVIRMPGREESFAVGDFAPLVGALLFREDSNVRILFAGGGPKALRQMLQSAAMQYFESDCEAR